MYRSGHIGFNAIIATAIYTVATALNEPTLGMIAAVIIVGTATLPDIDLHIPITTHRGITHTAWFALFTGLIAGMAVQLLLGLPGFTVGFAAGTLGVLGHLTADAFTPLGITFWYPLSRREYRIPLFTSGNPIANYLTFAIGIVTVLIATFPTATVAIISP